MPFFRISVQIMILGIISSRFSVDTKEAKVRTLQKNAAVNGKVQLFKGLMKRGADLCLMNNGGWNS